jgi:hypothetical protein
MIEKPRAARIKASSAISESFAFCHSENRLENATGRFTVTE